MGVRKKGDMSPRERAYYRMYHGFDPVTDKILLDVGGVHFRYQGAFPLVNDQGLHLAGVILLARVDVDATHPPNEGGIRNWILLKRADQEMGYECNHTVVCTIAPFAPVDGAGDAALPLLELAKARERPKVNLPPEEHFAALKAFARQFAAEGIEHMVRRTLASEHLRPGVLPIGFTAKMQKGIFAALWQLAPSATRSMVGNVILESANTLPEADFDSLLPMLDDIYGLREKVLQDHTFAQEIIANSRNEKLKEWAIKEFPSATRQNGNKKSAEKF